MLRIPTTKRVGLWASTGLLILTVIAGLIYKSTRHVRYQGSIAFVDCPSALNIETYRIEGSWGVPAPDWRLTDTHLHVSTEKQDIHGELMWISNDDLRRKIGYGDYDEWMSLLRSASNGHPIPRKVSSMLGNNAELRVSTGVFHQKKTIIISSPYRLTAIGRIWNATGNASVGFTSRYKDETALQELVSLIR